MESKRLCFPGSKAQIACCCIFEASCEFFACKKKCHTMNNQKQQQTNCSVADFENPNKDAKGHNIQSIYCKRLIINHLKGFWFVQKVLLTQLAGLKSSVAFLEYPTVEHRKLLATSVVGWPCQAIQKWRVL